MVKSLDDGDCSDMDFTVKCCLLQLVQVVSNTLVPECHVYRTSKCLKCFTSSKQKIKDDYVLIFFFDMRREDRPIVSS